MLTGLWLIALHQRWPTSTRRLNKKIRLYSVLGVGIVWLASAIVRAAGAESATYLTLILVWALPPVMLQLAYGADMLWQRRELVLTVIATSTLYLASADALAIYQGIWTIAPSTSLQINLLGVLPIEELVFFLITNVLVTFGVMLLIETTSHQRISRLQRGRLWNLVGGKKGIHT
ncbi:MAG: lycopene cyclase domain-containing protein [Chloroflexi bacterium]|nr:MAG: lycopene cyclase domain-containing protein [Chloroflexota bacterium]